MKVNGYGSIQSGSVKRRGGTAPAGGLFSDLLSASETQESGPSLQTGEVSATSLANLLSLQEVADDNAPRKKLVQQGNQMLDVLERLRRQLLLGTLPPHLIGELSRQVSQQKLMINDPALNDIISDIELRAAVELAKLERAASTQYPTN